MKKPIFGISNNARHRIGCTVIEDGQKFQISDLESKHALLSLCSKNKGADQLHSLSASLFLHTQIACFLMMWLMSGASCSVKLQVNSMKL